MWFYQNPPPSSPAIENDWSLKRSQSQERVVPNIFKLLRNTNFLLGRGGKGVYTTFSKDYTINLNNFREYFKEQWVDKTSCSNLLIFSVSFLSKSSMSSWVCLVFLFRLLASLLNVMVVSDHTAASSFTWPTVLFNFFVTFWICLVWLANLSNICLNSFSLPVPLTAVETWLLRFSRIADRAWPFVTVSRLFQKRLNLIKKCNVVSVHYQN